MEYKMRKQKEEVVKVEEVQKEDNQEKIPKVESLRLVSWADLEPERAKDNVFSKL